MDKFMKDVPSNIMYQDLGTIFRPRVTGHGYSYAYTVPPTGNSILEDTWERSPAWRGTIAHALEKSKEEEAPKSGPPVDPKNSELVEVDRCLIETIDMNAAAKMKSQLETKTKDLDQLFYSTTGKTLAVGFLVILAIMIISTSRR